MNSRRSNPDDIAELRGDFGGDPLIETAPCCLAFQLPNDTALPDCWVATMVEDGQYHNSFWLDDE